MFKGNFREFSKSCKLDSEKLRALVSVKENFKFILNGNDAKSFSIKREIL